MSAEEWFKAGKYKSMRSGMGQGPSWWAASRGIESSDLQREPNWNISMADMFAQHQKDDYKSEISLTMLRCLDPGVGGGFKIDAKSSLSCKMAQGPDQSEAEWDLSGFPAGLDCRNCVKVADVGIIAACECAAAMTNELRHVYRRGCGL